MFFFVCAFLFLSFQLPCWYRYIYIYIFLLQLYWHWNMLTNKHNISCYKIYFELNEKYVMIYLHSKTIKQNSNQKIFTFVISCDLANRRKLNALVFPLFFLGKFSYVIYSNTHFICCTDESNKNHIKINKENVNLETRNKTQHNAKPGEKKFHITFEILFYLFIVGVDVVHNF